MVNVFPSHAYAVSYFGAVVSGQLLYGLAIVADARTLSMFGYPKIVAKSQDHENRNKREKNK